MPRRLIVEEPVSQAAVWSLRVALFALAVAAIAVVLSRGGFVETIPAFVILASALALAALAILLTLAAFVVIWVNGNPGLGQAVAALFAGAALLAYPAYLAVQSYKLPAISDITTDAADPPRFEAAVQRRPRGANPAEYPGLETARQQRAAYPEIVPLTLSATPAEVYSAALEIVNRRRWRNIQARPPAQGARREGRIEATALTPVMGFRDDVVIRIRASGAESIVDIRSASRFGVHDFGANAQRVRSLLEEIEEEAGTQPAATQ